MKQKQLDIVSSISKLSSYEVCLGNYGINSRLSIKGRLMYNRITLEPIFSFSDTMITNDFDLNEMLTERFKINGLKPFRVPKGE